jgi:hypothetical protein
MGQSQSTGLQEETLSPNTPHIKHVMGFLDKIASSYIFTPSFNDMMKLDKKEYCDKLVLLTSKTLSKSFSKIHVDMINERIEKGTDLASESMREQIFYLSKKDLDILSKKHSSVRPQICSKIAKFYVKCSHVYSAIVKSVNPLYQYKNSRGELVYEPNKNKVPKGIHYKMVYFNYCSRRLSSIYLDQQGNASVKLCNLYEKSSKAHSLLKEFDIKHLEQLYYDTYNHETKSYDTMSEESRYQYKQDVSVLNRAINKREPMDGELSFKDIKHDQQGKCDVQDIMNETVSLNKSEFNEYGSALSSMNNEINRDQMKILANLNVLCLKYTDDSGVEHYTIHPELTDETLKELIVTVRTDIMNFYLKCQTNFNTIKELIYNIIVRKLEDNLKLREKHLQSLLL